MPFNTRQATPAAVIPTSNVNKVAPRINDPKHLIDLAALQITKMLLTSDCCCKKHDKSQELFHYLQGITTSEWKMKIWQKITNEHHQSCSDDQSEHLFGIWKALFDPEDSGLTIDFTQPPNDSSPSWTDLVFSDIANDNESKWKSGKVFLQSLPTLSDLHNKLGQFLVRFINLRDLSIIINDDDVFKIIGLNCPVLFALRAINDSSFNPKECRVTDKGINYFVEAQMNNERIKVLDLASLDSSEITVTSLETICRLSKLIELTVTGNFKGEGMPIDDNMSSLETLNISFKSTRHMISLDRLCQIFPKLVNINLSSLSTSTLNVIFQSAAETLAKVKNVSIHSMRYNNYRALSQNFPNMEILKPFILAQEDLGDPDFNAPFAHLRLIDITYHNSFITFSSICELLTNATNIKEMKFFASNIDDASDEALKNLFERHSHLRNMTKFSIGCERGKLGLTLESVRHLLSKCADMEKIGNFEHWSISPEELAGNSNLKLGNRDFTFIFRNLQCWEGNTSDDAFFGERKYYSI